MSTQHEISEYIENLPLEKTLCRGFRPDDVYEVICNISSMYNQLLSEAYTEIDDLKNQVEFLGQRTIEKQQKFLVEEPMFEERGMGSRDLDFRFLSSDEEKKQERVLSDKDLQRLKRGELLEIMLEQSRENESLKIQLMDKERELEKLEKQLANRKIEIEKAGTLAEASFKLNGVFEAAEKAAQQYLDNLEDLYEREEKVYAQKEAEVEMRCTALLQSTHERCAYMQEEIIKKCEDMEASVRMQCEELLRKTELRCKEREREFEERPKVQEQEIKSSVDRRWDDLSKRLDDFYARMKI